MDFDQGQQDIRPHNSDVYCDDGNCMAMPIHAIRPTPFDHGIAGRREEGSLAGTVSCVSPPQGYANHR